jgi:hypothetical protein
MRKFLTNLVYFAVVQVLIAAIVTAVYVRCRPLGQHYLAAAIDKQENLKLQSSPRIVFVGGSNLAFGLDSEEIAKQTKFHPVNMGLHVELGLNYVLNEVKAGLKPGDVVVVSPEYELFGEHYAGGGAILYTALEQHPADLRYYSVQNIGLVLNTGLLIAGEIIDYDVRCLSRQKDSYDPNDQSNAYRRNGFNEYGDVIAHHSLPPKPFVIPSIGPKITPATIARTIQDLNAFKQWCDQHDVVVVYSFPVVPDEYFKQNRGVIDEIQRAVGGLSFSAIDSPVEMTLPIEDFFDTPYHLTEQGTKLRTERLLRELKAKGLVQ